MTSKLNINWLNKCRCGNRMHTVETVLGSHVRLFEDDAVKCNSCGREGVIQTCDGIATVLWETDEERADGMALAAMDSEPVAWINGCNKSVPAALRYLAENPRPIGGESSFNTAHLYQLAREIESMSSVSLYRHAQPVPVVPDELNTRTANDVMNEHLSWKDYGDAEVFCIAWNACRAAMLNGGKP